jgi:hypothetical protein
MAYVTNKIFRNQKLEIIYSSTIDLTNESSSNIDVLYKSPSGTVSTANAPIRMTPYTDGNVKKTCIAGFLTATGIWSTKIYLRTQRIYGTVITFKVYDPWEA